VEDDEKPKLKEGILSRVTHDFLPHSQSHRHIISDPATVTESHEKSKKNLLRLAYVTKFLKLKR